MNPGKVWKPKEEEKVQINEDEKVETEWDEVLAQATEEELVDLAGLHLFCVLIVACFIQMQGRSSYMLQCYLCTMLGYSTEIHYSLMSNLTQFWSLQRQPTLLKQKNNHLQNITISIMLNVSQYCMHNQFQC